MSFACPTLTDLSADWQVGALANKEDCPSGQYTTGGKCCNKCQPGEGVVKPCGDTQTVCAPCLDSEWRKKNTHKYTLWSRRPGEEFIIDSTQKI